MGAIGHDGLAVPGKVVLAHEPSFTIGAVEADPATRQVHGASRSETLEPRVMEVFVALYRAGGIVTRDELIQRCWDGRIVGEDAINRVISRIRGIGVDIGEGSFSVETITKVGYRLSNAATKVPARASSVPPIDRRTLVGGAVAAAGAGGIGWLWSSGRPSDSLAEARNLRDRAIAVRQSYDTGDNRQAIAFLQEAVRISPAYGEGWGTLALAYSRALLDEPPARVAGFKERMDEAVRNAERFDPGNADAESIRWLGYPLAGDLNDIEIRARGFIERHPDHPAGHNVLGIILMNAGRWREAVVPFLAVKQRDAFNPIGRYQLALAYWSSGQFSRADNELDEAARRWPQHGAIAQTRIKVLALSGRPKAALDLATDPQTQPLEEPVYTETRLSFLRALVTGSAADIDKAVNMAVLRARRGPNDTVSLALNCIALGRTDLGLPMLEGVYLNIGEWAWPDNKDYISTHPLFQPHARALWRLPRFAAILNGTGLENYWRKSKSVPDFRHA